MFPLIFVPPYLSGAELRVVGAVLLHIQKYESYVPYRARWSLVEREMQLILYNCYFALHL